MACIDVCTARWQRSSKACCIIYTQTLWRLVAVCHKGIKGTCCALLHARHPSALLLLWFQTAVSCWVRSAACRNGSKESWLLDIIIIIIPSSHSINAIDPAPHRSGNNREHCSVMLVIIAHISSLNKILSNTPGNHSTHPLTTPHIIRHKTQQLSRSISERQHIATRQA
jgi:hypothetical protein